MYVFENEQEKVTGEVRLFYFDWRGGEEVLKGVTFFKGSQAGPANLSDEGNTKMKTLQRQEVTSADGHSVL
jgi:hypothetical protein